MSSMKGLEKLSRGYLGQEWRLFAPSVDEGVRTFAREEPEQVLAAIAGIEDLLASSKTEQQLDEVWILRLRSGYDPRDDGFTYREWFAHALDLLRSTAPETRDEPRGSV